MIPSVILPGSILLIGVGLEGAEEGDEESIGGHGVENRLQSSLVRFSECTLKSRVLYSIYLGAH